MTIIEQIKSKLDIVEEIGAIVPLKKSGKAYKGVCPFHSERTPSFYVFPQSGTWKCFGCQERGDMFTFVEKQQGLDFKESLALLAEKAGVPLEAYQETLPGSEEADQEEAARRRLRQINEAAAIWFHHLLLTSSEASYARLYLDGRGVNHDSITLFRLGFAPAGGDLLCTYLLSQEYSAQEIIAAGLGRERDPAREGRGGLYDYFRNRIIFPIRDARGRTVGFGGRELGGGSPKYLNTPQTPLFDKSGILYGLDLAREAIKRRDQAVIVEGYLDALVAHQYGEKNVVACIGSAITEKHVRQLKKLTKRLALALDPDAAGETATLRGIEVAQQGFDRVIAPMPSTPDDPRAKGKVRGMVRFEEQVDAQITILRLPPGEDPDEVIRQSVGTWKQALAEALPLVDFLFEAHTTGLRLDTPQGKTEAAKRLLPVLIEVRDRVKQDAYLRRLAGMLRTDERTLRQELDRLRRGQAREGRTGQHAPEIGLKSYMNERGDEQTEITHAQQAQGEGLFKLVPKAGSLEALSKAMEEYCLGLLLACPTLAEDVCVIIDEVDFIGTETRALYHFFVTALQNGTLSDTQRMLSTLPGILQETAERLRQEVEMRERMESISRIRRRPTHRAGHALETNPVLDSVRLKKVATKAAYRLKRARLKEAHNELIYLRQEAEQAGDQEGLAALDQRRKDVLLQIETIDSAVPLHS
ncbi:MAG TPA: DNA primase [Ktedonobacterales bacterium]|jgi:DNA primase